MKDRFFSIYMQLSIGLTALALACIFFLLDYSNEVDYYPTIFSPVILTSLLSFVAAFATRKHLGIKAGPSKIILLIVNVITITIAGLYLFFLSEETYWRAIVEMVLFCLCFVNSILFLICLFKNVRGKKEEEGEEKKSYVGFETIFCFSGIVVNILFSIAIIAYLDMGARGTIWYGYGYLFVIPFGVFLAVFAFSLLLFCALVFVKEQKGLAILTTIFTLAFVILLYCIVRYEIFRSFDTYWIPEQAKERSVDDSYYDSHVIPSGEDTNDYEEEHEEEEEIKPQYLDFLAESSNANMDSVKSAVRYVSEHSDFHYFYHPSYYDFPSEDFDYTASIPDSIKNKKWKRGKLPYTQILSYLDKNRSSVNVNRVFKAYKGILKLAISQERYNEDYRDNVDLLMLAYSDIQDHDGFEEIYTWMSDNDLDYDAVYKRMSYMVSAYTFSQFIETDYGSKSKIVRTFSFWGRRWHEGNAEECASVISDIQSMYYEEGDEEH